MPRYAAIDIGTNSVKITIAEMTDGDIQVLAELSEVTRLGMSVDSSRHLAEDAMQRTLDALRRFTDEAKRLGATDIRAGGTSALRDARNGEVFRDRAKRIIGSEVEVISGDREAQLTFKAAISDPRVLGASDGKLVAFDVGGGSTELIVGTSDKIERARSLDVGAVRLTERILSAETPSTYELNRARDAVDQTLSSFPKIRASRIIGVGGTATNVAAMLAPDIKDVQGREVSATEIGDLAKRLAQMPVAERRNIPGLDPARADVIVAGMLIISRILARFGAERFVVSTRGVRYGLLLDMVGVTQK